MKTYQKVIAHILSILSSVVMFMMALASVFYIHYGHNDYLAGIVSGLFLVVFGINVFLLTKRNLGKGYRYTLIAIIVGILLFTYIQLAVMWGVSWWN